MLEALISHVMVTQLLLAYIDTTNYLIVCAQTPPSHKEKGLVTIEQNTTQSSEQCPSISDPLPPPTPKNGGSSIGTKQKKGNSKLASELDYLQQLSFSVGKNDRRFVPL